MVFRNQQGGSNSGHLEKTPPGEVRSDCVGMDGEIFDESSTHRRTTDEEEKMDHRRTKCIVSRGTNYLRRTYGHWTDDMRRIATGVVLMSTTRDANVQEQARFLQLSLGGPPHRTHGGQTFLYEDGAPQLFFGVAPGHPISRCKSIGVLRGRNVVRLEARLYIQFRGGHLRRNG